MIWTSSAGGNIVYKLIAESEIPSLITGGVYKRVRPDNSKQEDLIIRPGTLRDGAISLLFIDLLLFVPDLQSDETHYEPDEERIEELSQLIVNVFNYQVGPQYTITCEENVVQQDENGQHYSFFRLLARLYEPVTTTI